MVLNAFDLTGKVAIVTGCDTGLGQGNDAGPGAGRVRYRRHQP